MLHNSNIGRSDLANSRKEDFPRIQDRQVQGRRCFHPDPSDDYLSKRKKVRTDLKRIDLRALHPLDIVMLKTGRLNARDKQEIEICVTRFKLTKQQVKKRAEEVRYAGNEEVYSSNLDYVLTQFG